MSWAGLQNILAEVKTIAREQAAKDPVACPFDGTPLDYHEGKNILHCPNGDFQVGAKNR